MYVCTVQPRPNAPATACSTTTPSVASSAASIREFPLVVNLSCASHDPLLLSVGQHSRYVVQACMHTHGSAHEKSSKQVQRLSSRRVRKRYRRRKDRRALTPSTAELSWCVRSESAASTQTHVHSTGWQPARPWWLALPLLFACCIGEQTQRAAVCDVGGRVATTRRSQTPRY
ncbi:uncharacterized protein BKA78DRAFT_191029 [Phyllosticta capitalensis]|uniref:uncharacterized protein n=1 Tax=Phyllosticta capitalensis TaxID=121624 RepID=UPI00312FB323